MTSKDGTVTEYHGCEVIRTTEENEMVELEERCKDCVHASKCRWIAGTEPISGKEVFDGNRMRCSWVPSRFVRMNPGQSGTKPLDVTGSEDLKNKVSDVEVFGDPDAWKLICKASSKSQGWMKSTKAMTIEGLGVLVQVTTQQGENIAEALQFIPGAKIVKSPDGELQIRGTYPK